MIRWIRELLYDRREAIADFAVGFAFAVLVEALIQEQQRRLMDAALRNEADRIASEALGG